MHWFDEVRGTQVKCWVAPFNEVLAEAIEQFLEVAFFCEQASLVSSEVK